MGGTLASVVNLIAISVTDNPLDMGFGYFLTAVIIIIIALFGYLALPLMVCLSRNKCYDCCTWERVLNLRKLSTKDS